MRPAAPRRVGLVRVRARIGEPVPVRRAPAQVAALLQRLRRHRGPHPDPRPGDLPLRRQPQRYHRLLVILGVPVDPPADLRHPQLDPVVLEQRGHRGVLAAVERPLVLPDHDRVPPALRISQLRHQRSRLRAPRPRQRPGLPCIEELRCDHPMTADEHRRLLQRPRPRRHRILPVLSRDPPVKREPQHPASACPRAARKAVRPRRQHIPARAAALVTRRARRHHRIHLPLPVSLDHRPQLPHPPTGKHQPVQNPQHIRHHQSTGATEKGKLHALSTRHERARDGRMLSAR